MAGGHFYMKVSLWLSTKLLYQKVSLNVTEVVALYLSACGCLHMCYLPPLAGNCHCLRLIGLGAAPAANAACCHQVIHLKQS